MLAQAAGSYRERPVEGVLQAHFACVWVHQSPRPEVQPVVVVPDGCIDLEWIDGALRIAGPDRAPKIERLAAGATVVGFRFRPAAAAAWLGLPGVRNRRPPHPAGGVLGRRCALRGRNGGRGARYRRARAGDRERVDAARAIDSRASTGYARGVRAARDRRAARQSADPMARRGTRAERADLAPALRRGIRIRAEDTRPHPAIFSASSNSCAAPAMARRLVSRWKPATPTRPISGAKAAGWRTRRLTGSQLSSRAARRNSGIASPRAPGHV